MRYRRETIARVPTQARMPTLLIVMVLVGQTIAFCRLPFSEADHEKRWSAPPGISWV
jgi:hypothetical protein